MAIYLQNNVGVKINSVNISSLVSAVTLTQTFDENEITGMGQSAHIMAKGLESSTLTIDFFNDWAAASVMQTLNSAYGTTVPVSLIAVAPTVSATNPTFAFTILVNNLTPVGSGGVGDEAASSLSFTVNSAVTQSYVTPF